MNAYCVFLVIISLPLHISVLHGFETSCNYFYHPHLGNKAGPSLYKVSLGAGELVCFRVIIRRWSLNIVYNLVTHNVIITDRKSYFAFCETTQLKTFSEAANQNKSQFDRSTRILLQRKRMI